MSFKVKDSRKGLAFVAGFLIAVSGLFEAVVLRLMSLKVKDIIYGTLFIAGFLFIGSGMFEAVVLRLLGLVGW